MHPVFTLAWFPTQTKFRMTKRVIEQNDDPLMSFKRMRTSSIGSLPSEVPESPIPHNDEVPMYLPETPSSDRTAKVFLPRSPEFCNCKNSKCLKLYCKCFKQDRYCSEKCGCTECFNKNTKQREEAMRETKEKNPLVFEKKNQAGIREKGCSCKHSRCLRNYCECFQSGSVCGKHCHCSNCGNREGSLETDLLKILKHSTFTFKLDGINFNF